MQTCPRPCADHEVDDLGRHLLGRADEVAFVFAVLGVDDDDHSAAADGVDGFVDGGELGHAGGVSGEAVVQGMAS